MTKGGDESPIKAVIRMAAGRAASSIDASSLLAVLSCRPPRPRAEYI